MKVKELKPILEHLDENAEIEFSIVSQQHENELRDNYRTCGDFTFGHDITLEDPDGLISKCWPIYGSADLVGYLRETDIGSFCNVRQARTKEKKYWKRVSIDQDELLEAIGEFLYEECGDDEFLFLFTQEDECIIVGKNLSDSQKRFIRYRGVGIVPLVYFEK